VDGCRVETEPGELTPRHNKPGPNGWKNSSGGYVEPSSLGRFPPNLLLTHSADCDESTCADDCPVAELGRQSGTLTSGALNQASVKAENRVYGKHAGYASPKQYEPDTGTAARFFPVFRYVAKASRRERNAGCEVNPIWLDSIELVWDNDSTTKIYEVLLWDVQGQNQSTDSNGEALPLRGIFGDGTQCSGDNGLPTLSNGNGITALSLMAIRFTTSTGIRQTIESKTLQWLTRLPTSERTADAIETIAGFGLSLVESAALQSLLKRITTHGGMVYPRGASNVPKRTLQQTSAKDVMQSVRGNIHSTVKPIALMQWLCRLVTPPGGTILDLFAGSGSTGVAALAEGFQFIGIEREAEYAAIARARIAAVPERLL
jgi:hypothetical protein